MSLEEKIVTLTEAVVALNTTISHLVLQAPSEIAQDKPETVKAAASKPAAKGKATPKAEPTPEPANDTPAEPTITFDELVEKANECAELDRDLVLATLRSCGTPEKDGGPKLGLLNAKQWAGVYQALVEAMEEHTKKDTGTATSSFV